MKKEIIYSMDSGFREEFQVVGYRFGGKEAGIEEKAACIVGSMRGNEYQQLYICAMLMNRLAELEEKGAIVGNNQILIIPSLNNVSMNVEKRFWTSDNTDINRQFPGNEQGEPTSRIAAAVMKAVEGYRYGIQFASFYKDGEFISHVRMPETGKESTSLANLFGLPYVMVAKQRSFDSKTLNYNWQIRGTEAFSLYTSNTEKVDEAQARQAVSAVLRFLTRMGILRYNCHNGYIASILEENELVNIKSSSAGFFRKLVHINDEVKRGDVLAEIIDPYLGNTISEIHAPVDGILFYSSRKPIILQNSIAFQIIKKLHE
ncbi:MAG: M14 family metallopeptidase [Lachnospiraceae bacterium]|nr:M14 family metallopeptidase [Lachnospiraceae bacterium]